MSVKKDCYLYKVTLKPELPTSFPSPNLFQEVNNSYSRDVFVPVTWTCSPTCTLTLDSLAVVEM